MQDNYIERNEIYYALLYFHNNNFNEYKPIKINNDGYMASYYKDKIDFVSNINKWKKILSENREITWISSGGSGKSFLSKAYSEMLDAIYINSLDIEHSLEIDQDIVGNDYTGIIFIDSINELTDYTNLEKFVETLNAKCKIIYLSRKKFRGYNWKYTRKHNLNKIRTSFYEKIKNDPLFLATRFMLEEFNIRFQYLCMEMLIDRGYIRKKGNKSFNQTLIIRNFIEHIIVKRRGKTKYNGKSIWNSIKKKKEISDFSYEEKQHLLDIGFLQGSLKGEVFSDDIGDAIFGISHSNDSEFCKVNVFSIIHNLNTGKLSLDELLKYDWVIIDKVYKYANALIFSSEEKVSKFAIRVSTGIEGNFWIDDPISFLSKICNGVKTNIDSEFRVGVELINYITLIKIDEKVVNSKNFMNSIIELMSSNFDTNRAFAEMMLILHFNKESLNKLLKKIEYMPLANKYKVFLVVANAFLKEFNRIITVDDIPFMKLFRHTQTFLQLQGDVKVVIEEEKKCSVKMKYVSGIGRREAENIKMICGGKYNGNYYKNIETDIINLANKIEVELSEYSTVGGDFGVEDPSDEYFMNVMLIDFATYKYSTIINNNIEKSDEYSHKRTIHSSNLLHKVFKYPVSQFKNIPFSLMRKLELSPYVNLKGEDIKELMDFALDSLKGEGKHITFYFNHKEFPHIDIYANGEESEQISNNSFIESFKSENVISSVNPGENRVIFVNEDFDCVIEDTKSSSNSDVYRMIFINNKNVIDIDVDRNGNNLKKTRDSNLWVN